LPRVITTLPLVRRLIWQRACRARWLSLLKNVFGPGIG
jgi:hypothetical protein